MSTPLDISAPILCESLCAEPTEARLAVGEEELVVATGETTARVEFPDVFDLRVGPAPQAAASHFGGTVLTVGFGRDGQREVLFVDGETETLDRVGGILYRRLLDGSEVAVRHPAEMGGRVTDRSFGLGELRVAPEKVGCTGVDVPFGIDLNAVVDVSRSTRELLGDRRPVIEFTYIRDGIAVAVELSIEPERKQHLLGRYLRRNYDEIRDELREINLPDAALRALVTLYSLRGSAKPQTLLGADSVSTAAVMRELVEADLVRVSDGRASLTPRGWILVTAQVGDDDGPAGKRPTPAD